MGDGADEALDREMNEWMEETRPVFGSEDTCPICNRPILNCICNEHPYES